MITVVDRKVMIEKNADGSYTIPKIEGVLPADYYYLVEDEAGNISYSNFAVLRELQEGEGILNIKLLYSNVAEDPKFDITYLIHDEAGNAIEKLNYYDNRTTSLRLPFGKYSVELVSYDANGAELLTPKTLAFELTKDKKFEQVQFQFSKSDSALVRIVFDQILPEGSKVMLRAQDGQLVELDQSLYVPSAYGKSVRDGHYEILVELPTGYRVSGAQSL
ncbi:hypothetical protein D3X11_01725 [Streptococcus sp. X16XC17]|uniref:hypothetical protein n=1 Tax=unclassified Streptococcus TaxID=2608887 RepID=UPI00069F1355|nr:MULTISPECIES: hypothetical protein [unclassified Streptococcus]TCD46202.1 hypothetical protein D3X11_01725 [Streptococcus sp. X16XC17]